MSPACWLGSHEEFRWGFTSAIIPGEISDADVDALRYYKTQRGASVFMDIDRHRDATSFTCDWTRSGTWPTGRVWESS